MNTKSCQQVSFQRRSDLLNRYTVVCTIGLAWIVGCKSDRDHEVNAPAGAGRSSSVPSTSAGGPSAGGTSAAGAGGTQTGATAGATAEITSGGSSAGAANNAHAGKSQGIAGATASCPTYSRPQGTMLTPPSDGFETDVDGWTTMTAKTESISRKELATSACQGSSYLACDGATRSGGWDGPKLGILAQVVAGHQYVVTVAARFDPENAPPSAVGLTLSTAMACTDSTVATTYRRLQEGITTTDWVRLTGTLDPSLVGCAQLSEVTVYVETDATLRGYSIDLDDFQLWDVTPTTAIAGTGGAAGAAGSGS